MHIDSATTSQRSSKYPLGQKLAEGKTKMIYAVKGQPDLAVIVAKDDITAGDGARHDLLPGKAIWATDTTCNVFELLKAYGIPIAYVEQDSVNSFIAPLCDMLSYEVVVRREAHGSYLKRFPHVQKGEKFPELLVEFYLKTKNREWKGRALPCDDPLLIYNKDSRTLRLYRPDIPFDESAPFMELNPSIVWSTPDEGSIYPVMGMIAKDAFLVLESAWGQQDAALADFKLEFGRNKQGKLLIADVIDNDSWRVVRDGNYVDKQSYRNGASLHIVADLYRSVAEITKSFVKS